MTAGDAEWVVSTMWAAAPGPDGGYWGSAEAQPVSGPEASYQDAAARARAESLLPGVTDSQIFRDDQWHETWTDGDVTDTSRRRR